MPSLPHIAQPQQGKKREDGGQDEDPVKPDTDQKTDHCQNSGGDECCVALQLDQFAQGFALSFVGAG